MTALLVIDAQSALVKGAYREAETLVAINSCIEKIRAQGGQVIFIQHCHANYEPLKKGQPGWQVHPALDRRDEDWLVEKQASDAFYETELANLLANGDITKLYITGLQTEFCVDTTCRAALSRGFEVCLVSDAHTTGNSHLSAPEIIDHHNKILANLAHPTNNIKLISSKDIHTTINN